MIYAIIFFVAFIISILVGLLLLPILRNKNLRQTIYELGPKTHEKKQGTPTMGGLIFIIPIILISIILLFVLDDKSNILLLSVSGGLFGLIGFVDDYIKIFKRRNLGLTEIQKIIFQVLSAIIICFIIYRNSDISTSIYIPIIDTNIDLGYWFYPFIAFIFIAASNSANLLDGLDGLLISNSIVIYIFYGLVFVFVGLGIINSTLLSNCLETNSIIMYILSSLGAFIGFAIFNKHPAKVFMGDIGSLYIGAVITMLSIMTNTLIVLPIVALTLVISSLSVIIQRVYFKITKGKRIFKMSPLHYHFELSGYKETKIVSGYTLTETILCLIVLLILIFL